MLNDTTFHPHQNVDNSCTSNNFKTQGDLDSLRSTVKLTVSLVIAVLCPVAVVGNALILATIWKKSFQRASFHILLSGMALTDFFTGLIAQPSYVSFSLISSSSATVTQDQPVAIVVLRVVTVFSAIYFVTITLLTITVMSIERWFHMSGGSSLSSRCRFFVVIVIVILPIPLVTLYFLNPPLFPIIVPTEMFSCYLVTSFAYFKIYRIIRSHQNQIQTNGIPRNFGHSAIDLTKYKRSVATILYILLLFSLCFLPYIVSNAVSFLIKADPREWSITIDVTMVLVFLSSSLSPGLYLWRMRDIRNGLKELIVCRRT
ncbi:histamine H2 receptor-like [Stylophora pistillata]|uniref:histamine H2 receptor-like n=1 Tax=Stylophora pistillata TaxID=50429 RepID=UPI000C052839|nr:histamine H2 receptor-like [Stylophora pistillata]